VVNPNLGETCDDGLLNGVSPSPCRANCQLTTCGDGYRGGVEACDDANPDDGDGCSAACQVEDRYTCGGTPSVCTCAGYNHGAGCAECVVFVDGAAAAAAADGRSWATAFPTVQ
jgi:cysteine-rich repeat protein